jgi:Mn2+/Fe2+ NRAMP family transporter
MKISIKYILFWIYISLFLIATAAFTIRNNQENNDPSKVKHIDLQKKILIAHITTLLFIIVSNPIFYKFTNQVAGIFLKNQQFMASIEGVPTTIGLFLHGVLFFLIILLITQPWQQVSCVCQKGFQTSIVRP